MNDMYFWVALGSSRGGMNMVTTEITAEVQQFFNREISPFLVTEGDDFLLGNK